MFYKKQLPLKSLKTKTVVFDDFSGGMNCRAKRQIPSKYASVCFNLSGDFGSLKQNFGIDELPLQNGDVIKSVKCFKLNEKTYAAYVDERNAVKTFALDKPDEVQQIFTAQGHPDLFAFKSGVNACLIISDDGGSYLYDGESVVKIEGIPKLDCAVLYYERVFGISHGSGGRLCFSAVLKPSNWAEGYFDGGYIEFDDDFGQVLDAAVLNGKLFAFGADKIAEVSATSSQDEFFIKKIYALHGEVIKNTVKSCGNKIVFLTTDGLYAFDGNSAIKLASNLDDNFVISGCEQACFFNAKYYLACKLDFSDKRKIGCERRQFNNNAIVEVVLADGLANICRGVDVCSLSKTTDGVLIAAGGKLGRLTDGGMFFGRSLPKVWESLTGDFGINGIKTVKGVSLYTDTDVTLKIVADGITRSFYINGKNNFQQIKTGVCGRFFKICFESVSSKPKIINPTFQVTYTQGGDLYG